MDVGEPPESPTGTSRDLRTKEPFLRLDPGASQGGTNVKIASTTTTEDVGTPSTPEGRVEQDAVEDAAQGQATEDVGHRGQTTEDVGHQGPAMEDRMLQRPTAYLLQPPTEDAEIHGQTMEDRVCINQHR